MSMNRWWRRLPGAIENTLQPFDNAQNELGVAGAEAYLMFAVAPQKDVRDAGQALSQERSSRRIRFSI